MPRPAAARSATVAGMAMAPQYQAIRRERLPQLIGVAGVCAALGISRSTLDRMHRDGGFSPAERLSPNRVGWRPDAIEADLATHAKASPEVSA